MSKITGLEQFRKELAAMEAKVRNKTLRDALRSGAKVIAAAVKSRAPVETGRTRRSVKVRAGKRKRDQISTQVIVTGGHDQPFIGFLEYGTSKQPANPFIRGGFAAKEAEVRAEALDQIKRAIEETGR